MRDATTLFEQELPRRNRCSMMPNLFGFMGMVEWDLESIYNLLLSTLDDIDSKSGSEGTTTRRGGATYCTSQKTEQL